MTVGFGASDPIRTADDLFARLADAERTVFALAEREPGPGGAMLETRRARRGFVRRLDDRNPADVMRHVAETAATAGFDERRAHIFLSRFLSASRDYAGLAIYRDALSSPPSPRPSLIALGGLSGVGKSTVARALVGKLGAPGAVAVLSADVARKRMHGRAPEDRLPESAYATDVSERVYRRLRVDARRALLAGADALVEATFTDPRGRLQIEQLAQKLGAPFFGVWLSVAESERLDRVARRSDLASRDAVAAGGSDATLHVARGQRLIGKPTWRRMTTTRPPDDVAAEIASRSTR